MTTKLISSFWITALFALILSNVVSAEETTAEKRDFKIAINRKGKIYPTKNNGEIETVHFEIVAQADDRAVTDPSTVTLKYQIFYFEDSVSLKRGGLYKSVEGSLSLGEDRDAQKKPLKTDSVKIHDTVEMADNSASRKRNSDIPLISQVTGEREDKLIGILLDVVQNGKIIASYSDRSRIVKIAERLRKDEKELTPEAFK